MVMEEIWRKYDLRKSDCLFSAEGGADWAKARGPHHLGAQSLNM